jgi:SAM-dependent MidA family methyltransferase
MNAETWSGAWRRAARDFWRTERPGSHFSTSAGPVVADRIAEIVLDVDARLGHPTHFTVVDIGCGDGSLLTLVRERSGELAARARWVGVDVHPPRAGSIESVKAQAPCNLDLAPIRGVVMAHEWLDEIPCDVVERDVSGVDRLVLIDRGGSETLGPRLDDAHACAEYGVDAPAARAWMERWWPLRETGDRAEIGIERDRAWRWMSSLVDAGSILATDYGHAREERIERYRHGTLCGYREGRVVRPSPDGAMNLTAHVAVDACADSLPGTTLTRQRQEVAIAPLGAQPTPAEVERYFTGLRLSDPGVWGDISWLRWDA